VTVKAWGTGLSDVFVQISKGMWSLILGDHMVPCHRKWIIETYAMDVEELLVNFLNEQILLLEVNGLAVSDIEGIVIEQVSTSENASGCKFHLRSTMLGSRLPEVNIEPEIQIKAATFYEIQVNPTHAQVTFDV
jgi:SHS2 domain-containing protein